MTTPKPTLNLETVYIVTSDFYKHSVLITESEISTIRRHLSALALGLDEKFPYRDGDRLVDYQGDEFARIASPEERPCARESKARTSYPRGTSRSATAMPG